MEMHYSKILLIVASVLHVSSSAYQFQPVQGGCSYWKFLSEDINRDKTKRLHCILDQHNQTGIIYTTWQLIPAGKCPYFDRYAGKLRTFICDRRYGSCPKDSFHSNEVRRMEGCYNGLAIRQAYRELQQMNNSSPASNKQNEGENIKIIIAVISTLVIETLVICTCKFCVCSSKGRIWRNCGKKGYRYSAVKTRDEENRHRLKRCKGKGEYMPVQTTDDEDEEEQSNWQGSIHAMACLEGRISETDTDVKRCEEDFHLPYIPHVHRDLKAPPDAVKVQPNSQNETWIMDFIPLLSERESHKLLDDKEKTDGQIGICHEDRNLGTDTKVKASSESLICQENRTSETDTDVERFSQDMICHESRTSGTDAHLKGKGEDCHLPIPGVHKEEVGPDAGKVQQNSQNEIFIKDFLPSSSTKKSHELFESKEKLMGQIVICNEDRTSGTHTDVKASSESLICQEDRTSGTDTDIERFSQDMICHESRTSGTDVHLKGKGEDCHLPITCVHQDLEVGSDAGEVQQNSQNEILIKNFLLSSSTRKSYEPFESKEKVMATQTKVPENEGYNEECQARKMKNQASQTNMPETEGHQTKQMENQATQTNVPEYEGNNEKHQAKHIDSQATQTNMPEIEGHQTKQMENQATQTNRPENERNNVGHQGKNIISQVLCADNVDTIFDLYADRLHKLKVLCADNVDTIFDLYADRLHKLKVLCADNVDTIFGLNAVQSIKKTDLDADLFSEMIDFYADQFRKVAAQLLKRMGEEDKERTFFAQLLKRMGEEDKERTFFAQLLKRMGEEDKERTFFAQLLKRMGEEDKERTFFGFSAVLLIIMMGFSAVLFIIMMALLHKMMGKEDKERKSIDLDADLLSEIFELDTDQARKTIELAEDLLSEMKDKEPIIHRKHQLPKELDTDQTRKTIELAEDLLSEMKELAEDLLSEMKVEEACSKKKDTSSKLDFLLHDLYADQLRKMTVEEACSKKKDTSSKLDFLLHDLMNNESEAEKTIKLRKLSTTAGGTESVFGKNNKTLHKKQESSNSLTTTGVTAIYVNTPNKESYNEDNPAKLINNQATKMNSINNELHSEDNQAKYNDSRAISTNNLKILAYNEDDQAKHNSSQDSPDVKNGKDAESIKTDIPNNRRHNEVTQWNIPLIERHRQLDQPGHMDNKDSELHKLLNWFVISMTKLISKDSVTKDINTLYTEN